MERAVTFSPFTRVEGDLRMSVSIRGGVVTEARATGTLFRGFEALLRGREPTDAIVFTCRICGQCGAAHAAAAAQAIAQAAHLEPPPNALLVRNVLLAVETILNNLTHFYQSFAADLARPRYGEEMVRRFSPIEGTSYRGAIRARRALLGLMGLVAGKWPNSLICQPGGVTRTIEAAEVVRARGVLHEFREFLERQVLGGPLDEWLTVETAAAFDRWLAVGSQAEADLGRFARTALSAGLDRLGAGPGRFLSAGGFPQPDGSRLCAAGFLDGALEPFDAAAIVEDARYAWLESEPGPQHPFDGATRPAAEKADAYTWCKAPRYRGRSAEVGPLANALVAAGGGVIRDLVARHGPGVFTRMLARLNEMLLLVDRTDAWLTAIDPEEPFCVPTPPVEDGTGVGLVAAPRGMLGHWLRIEKGRIRNYQVVTPTGWNLSPRDREGRPGPVEEALVGTEVGEADDGAAMIAHVVRSFDPCLFCTVH